MDRSVESQNDIDKKHDIKIDIEQNWVHSSLVLKSNLVRYKKCYDGFVE